MFVLSSPKAEAQPYNRPESPYGQFGLVPGATLQFGVHPSYFSSAGRLHADLFVGGGLQVDASWVFDAQLSLRFFRQMWAPSLTPGPMTQGLPRVGNSFGASARFFMGHLLGNRLQLGPELAISLGLYPSVPSQTREGRFGGEWVLLSGGVGLRTFLSGEFFVPTSVICGAYYHFGHRGPEAVDGFCEIRSGLGLSF
ncbi:MAG: hypothetical protein KDK66_02545 [Deltaproteobacteria bacterium]|nr:hypothetical protein [Deltaproteobacteria bacterium]